MTSLIRLGVRASAADAERVLAGLLELAPSGVEQVDGDGFVEYALYGAPGELPSLPEGEALIAGHPVVVRGEPVPDDWSERWKRFHSAVLVGGRLWVRPPWEEPAVRPGVYEIVIDPGQAFGTGTHPTTRMCLELLLELEARGSLADLGCGSGVLAIAAAKLGFAPITAVDVDEVALESARENAEANGVEVEIGDSMRPAALAVMNIALEVVEGLLPKLEVQRAITSGYLERDDPSVAGWQRIERRVHDGWAADLLEFRP